MEDNDRDKFNGRDIYVEFTERWKAYQRQQVCHDGRGFGYKTSRTMKYTSPQVALVRDYVPAQREYIIDLRSRVRDPIP
jgi:hypothetical protein